MYTELYQNFWMYCACMHFYYFLGRAEEICAVHLINEGLSLQRGNVVIQFQGSQAVQSYLCRMDYGAFEYCEPAVKINTHTK